MRGCLLLIFLIGIVANGRAQWIEPTVVCTMPSIINESSGVEICGDSLFWSHNDSGGDPEIYGFNMSGNLIRTVQVTNASNVDWEEMAQAEDGTFFIGDFGNNSNNRSLANGTPLRIYVIPNPADIVGTSISAGIIEFEYENRDFSAPSNNHEFDMEAMFWHNDTLHLFNKNRTNPTNGYIKHYVLPATPGVHTAMLVDSMYNGGTRITAADISPCGRYVALLAMDRMYLISCFSGSKYLSNSFVRTFSFPTTQKEAVVFRDYKTIYITDEQTSTVGRKLYVIDVSSYVAEPMQATADITPDCAGAHLGSITLSINGGTPPIDLLWSHGHSGNPASALPLGAYAVTLTDAQGCQVDTLFNVPGFSAQVPTVLQYVNLLYTNNVGTYQWMLNGSPITGANNDSLWVLQDGIYALSFTDDNGCTSVSQSITMQFNHVNTDDASVVRCVRFQDMLSVENVSDQEVSFSTFGIDGRLLYASVVVKPGEIQRMIVQENQPLLIRIWLTSGDGFTLKR